MRTNVGTIALSKWRVLTQWTPSHASKMPTMQMILTVQHSGLQARPLLGISHLIFPATLLKRDTHLSSFLQMRAEPHKGWGLASTAQGLSQES